GPGAGALPGRCSGAPRPTAALKRLADLSFARISLRGIAMITPRYGPGIEIVGPMTDEYAEILTGEAVAFAARLQRAFGGRRADLLAHRATRQRELDPGKLPDFLPETRPVREASWTFAPVRGGIQEHRVDTTGPADR